MYFKSADTRPINSLQSCPSQKEKNRVADIFRCKILFAVFRHVNNLFKFQMELHSYRLQQCQYTHTKPVGSMVKCKQ